MMFRATEEISEAFDEHDIKYRIFEADETSRVGADVQVGYTAFCIWFISSDDDSDVAVRVPNFVRFRTEEEKKRILRVVNEMNRKYRYIKFSLIPHENSVILEYDFPASTQDIGKTSIEIFHRMIQIAHESYQNFMKALWGSDQFFGNAVFYEYKY